MIKDIISLILHVVKIIGYLTLVTMGIVGLNNYWSDHTTVGFIASVISIFVIVYVVTTLIEEVKNK